MWPTIILIAGIAAALLFVLVLVMRRPRRRLTLADAIERLDLSETDARDIRTMAYHRVEIPKRRGGQRVLHIPDEPTKQLQRRILRRLLSRARCHRCAVGFERGRSIVDAARPHVGKDVVLRIDIAEFFPSTTSERVRDWFRRSGWDDAAAEFLTRCVTHEGALPQGAPTSPRISNLVNARLDGAFFHLALRFGGHYTRYADDITLSFDGVSGRRVRAVLQISRRILKRFGYRMQGRKTRILRKHQRQDVLGLTVNAQVAVSRRMRRRLRAARHQQRVLGECAMSPSALQGWTAFEDMVRSQR